MRYSHHFNQFPEMIFKKEECIPLVEDTSAHNPDLDDTAEYDVSELISQLLKCKED